MTRPYTRYLFTAEGGQPQALPFQGRERLTKLM